MKGLIMANGEYRDLNWYEDRISSFGFILCADGASAVARRLSIIPDGIVGDMDSTKAEDLRHMTENQVEIYKFPIEKDCTDTFLALKIMAERSFNPVVIWGATGKRLDHTMANIFGAIPFVKNGMTIVFEEPGLTIHIVKDGLNIEGSKGDTVSVFSLAGGAEGLYLEGFKYPLNNYCLKPELPIGISNALVENCGRISLKTGVLAIFHYRR